MKFFILAFILFNLIVYLGLHLYAKHGYITKLIAYHKGDERFKDYDKYLNLKLPKQLKEELGFTFYNTEHSYDKYILKTKDKPRIGILGNSLSWGSEINPNLSYTNLLNKENLSYDFISLAAPSYGLFRSERLLNFYKEQLNLDKVILGPFLLEPNKDLTFDMMFGSLAGGYSHGRYIYNNKLKFISPNQSNSSDRFNNLNKKIKLLPNMNEILYDYHGPYSFHLISKLFNKSYINPLYDFRKKSVFEEYKYISEKLIEKLVKNYQVISLDLKENINQNLSSSFPELTDIINIDIPQKIPYWKLRHPSELGHKRIKDIIQSFLSNEKIITMPLKVCTNRIEIDSSQNPIGLYLSNKQFAKLNQEIQPNPQNHIIFLTENNDFINSSIILVPRKISKFEFFLDNKRHNIVKKIHNNIYSINFPNSKLVKGLFPINRLFYFPNTSNFKIKADDEVIYQTTLDRIETIKNLNFLKLHKLNEIGQITNNMGYQLFLPNKLTISGNFKYECN